MSEKYTPDEAELIGCYAGAMEEQAGEDYATAKADAERGIAKVKADALREAADGLLNNPPSVDIFGKPLPGHIEAQRRLLATADRIESGDGQ